MGGKQHRREFFKIAPLAGAGHWIGGSSCALGQDKSANERLRFACIGVSGKGASDMADAARHGDVVAICDVDERTLDGAARRHPKAQRFVDFRKMFDELHKRIDAVTVSTPDHTHAVATAMAMKLGKHCYTQKPLTHSIYEARRLGEIAREMKVATQMGNQGTANERLRRGAALVRAGAIGAVKEVHVWTNRPIWPQGVARPTTSAAPAHLHWDLWLGPAPARPHAEGYHPFKWRGFWDFGTGALGDMACHIMNMPFMALDLRDPISVEAESSGHNKDSFPAWSIIRYAFAARGSRPALTMTWYDGGKRPAAELLDGREASPGGGYLLIGEKGKMYATGQGGGVRFLGDVTESKVEYERSPGHFAELVRAMKGGPPAMSNFPDYAGPLTETVLLGNLAVWSGKKVEWDAKNLKAKGTSEVESIIKREYRKGYTL
jgi:predicted dehydrogenase